jgi:predicted esterase YcpF (UPF0227 family)
MTVTHLLYLHGFRSSPLSAKAVKMAAAVQALHPAVHWWCPQLPPSPRQAMAMLMAGIAGWPQGSMAVVGSSLGGFYATWIAARTGCPAVLLNPAVHPARDLASHIGEQSAWHSPQETFFFQPEFVQELRDLDAGSLSRPERFYTLIAKGDELLDWREMSARYDGSQGLLLEGGDHALSDFDAHLAGILGFLALA